MKKNLDLILSYTKLEGECLIWTRCLNTDGYPRAVIDGNNNAKVHRVVYELVHGCIPDGDVVRHKCDNPKCINPRHLESGTFADNNRDRDLRNRNGQAKINRNEVKAIRLLYSEGLYKQKELADMFGINERTVSSLINRTHWKHVE